MSRDHKGFRDGGARRNDQTLGDLLRRNDPASGSAELGPVEQARMRQAAVEACRGPAAPGAVARPFLPWPIVAGVVAMVLVAAGLGVLTHRQSPRTGLSPEKETPGVAADSSGDSAHVVRQVQIDTPGGTHVVWILNSDFTL